LKDKEFRKLLAEYAEEISNPENKKVCVCVGGSRGGGAGVEVWRVINVGSMESLIRAVCVEMSSRSVMSKRSLSWSGWGVWMSSSLTQQWVNNSHKVELLCMYDKKKQFLGLKLEAQLKLDSLLTQFCK